MIQPKNDLRGKKFGRLTPVEYVIIKGKRNKWLCVCDCGMTTMVQGSDLMSGRTTSCGCYARERRIEFNRTTKTTHGESGGHGRQRSRLYVIWMGMIQRCENPTHEHDRRNYSGKGITVCDEWHDYIKFKAWAENNGYRDVDGERRDRYSIDRINTSKGYTPENCRWITLSENCRRAGQANQR